MTAQQKNSTMILGALVLLVVLGLGYFLYSQRPAESVSSAEDTAQTETAAETTETAPAPEVSIDLEAALSDRILGDVNAPLKISEHASLTCSHCGDFHKNTFAAFKSAYLDTGKAYLVFSDFPLNAPAIHASMVARCLPQDKYFDFIGMLFEQQDQWAYDVGYLTFLKTKAAENGLDEAHFQACLQNQDLQNGILARMKNTQASWEIKSTPSFVINNETVISGALPFEEFKKSLDAAASQGAQDLEPAEQNSPSEDVTEETPAEEEGGSAVPAESPPAE